MRNFLIIGCVVFSLTSCEKKSFDVVIRGATVYDGIRSDEAVFDVGINADTIVFVGDLSKAIGVSEVDGKGLILAPRFIDTQSHHDRGLSEDPSGLALVSQGREVTVPEQNSHFKWAMRGLWGLACGYCLLFNDRGKCETPNPASVCKLWI